MKILEFVKKNEEENVDLQDILEMRTYIPIAEKRVILETVLDTCYTVTDGILTCDYILKKMAFELAMIKYHTNLEVDITSEEDYDEIQKMGVNIHWGYEADYNECASLMCGMEQELCAKYSIEASVANLCNQFSNSIEKLTNTIGDKVAGLNLSDFGFNDLELGKFKDLLSKYGNQI